MEFFWKIHMHDQHCDVWPWMQKNSFQIAKSLISLRALGVGDWTFPVAAARVWNSRPQHVTSAQSLPVFRSRLKTHLFRRWLCCCVWEATLSLFGHVNRFLTCLLEKLWTSKLTIITYQTISIEDKACILTATAGAARGIRKKDTVALERHCCRKKLCK